MNVLSLFDGISCGRVALERAGIEVENYYASEVEKYAITVSEKNFPDIARLGDVNNWRDWDIDWAAIDLLIGGSPCQGFSFAGKQLALDDPRSVLFLKYVEILNHIMVANPDVKFLLENVKMKKEFENVITEMLGVDPVEINSALVSAQNRKRLYWANWFFGQPEDKGIFLKDVVHESVDRYICAVDRDKSHCITGSVGRTTDRDYFEKYKGGRVFCFDICIMQRAHGFNKGGTHAEKSPTLTSHSFEHNNHVVVSLEPYIVPLDKTLQILNAEATKGKIGYFRKDTHSSRVYSIHGKAVTLCGEAGGGAAKMGQYLFGCITPDRVEKCQNGQRFNEGEKFYTLTAQDKHGVLVDGYIRKLTPIECERLQTLPDDYTAGVSDSQRYKCLGNGWTVDVIAHILRSMK